MNSSVSGSGSGSVVVQRRARRRRASLTLYGNPLHSSHTPISPAREAHQPDALSTRQIFTEGDSAPGTERDAAALLQAIDRVQAEARRDTTLTYVLSRSELDRVVESIVRELWHDSPIKTFVPVLALRQTRERITMQQGEP